MSVYRKERLLWVRKMKNVLKEEVIAKVGLENWMNVDGKVGTKGYKIQMDRWPKQRPSGRNGSIIQLPHCGSVH